MTQAQIVKQGYYKQILVTILYLSMQKERKEKVEGNVSEKTKKFLVYVASGF